MRKLQRVLLAATIGSACGVGCAAASQDQETNSRQLIGLTRLEHSPAGNLGVSDDGLYEFVDFSAKRVHDGKLSSSEMEMLERHVASPRLDAVYEAQDPDGDRCASDAAGLILHTHLGTACIVTTDVADQSIRKSLELFATLFDTKAAETQ